MEVCILLHTSQGRQHKCQILMFQTLKGKD
nr:MAG TPA: hypothetical protein [Caudoviricetes sp.]